MFRYSQSLFSCENLCFKSGKQMKFFLRHYCSRSFTPKPTNSETKDKILLPAPPLAFSLIYLLPRFSSIFLHSFFKDLLKFLTFLALRSKQEHQKERGKLKTTTTTKTRSNLNSDQSKTPPSPSTSCPQPPRVVRSHRKPPCSLMSVPCSLVTIT